MLCLYMCECACVNVIKLLRKNGSVVTTGMKRFFSPPKGNFKKNLLDYGLGIRKGYTLYSWIGLGGQIVRHLFLTF